VRVTDSQKHPSGKHEAGDIDSQTEGGITSKISKIIALNIKPSKVILKDDEAGIYVVSMSLFKTSIFVEAENEEKRTPREASVQVAA